MRGISGLANNRLASQEGLCSMDLVSKLCRRIRLPNFRWGSEIGGRGSHSCKFKSIEMRGNVVTITEITHRYLCRLGTKRAECRLTGDTRRRFDV
jgi:hypothetical protein